MRRAIYAIAVTLSVLALLFKMAGRNPAEFRGLVRASAESTVEHLKEQIPQEVHDRKLDHDLGQVRQDLIDRQAKMNISRSQVEQLQENVEKLSGSIARRKRLLAEAYPVLRTAIDGQQSRVKFANQDYVLADFQRELDDLILQQDHETKQLDIQRKTLERLEASRREAEQALVEMRQTLIGAEQEVVVLRSRREQAEIESETLDLLAAVGADREAANYSVNSSLDHLRTGVQQTEGRNEARRSLAPATDQRTANQLDRQWSRLETLKAIHESVQLSSPTTEANKPTSANTETTSAGKESASERPMTATEVRIEIRGKE